MPTLVFTQVVRLCRSAAIQSSLIRGETSVTAVEYSLLIVFVATAIVTVVRTLCGQLFPGFHTLIAGL